MLIRCFFCKSGFNQLFSGIDLCYLCAIMSSVYHVNVKALNRGDRDEFTSLYNHYWKQVYNFCRLYLTNDAAVEEVVQDVFIKIWEIRHTIDDNYNFKGFLFIITRNLIFSKFRKDVNEEYYKLTVLNSLQQSYTIEEEIEAKDLNEYIDLLLDELPERCREVFILSRKENKSYKEIAALLSVSEKTVENHISKALKYLKENIRLLSIFLSFVY